MIAPHGLLGVDTHLLFGCQREEVHIFLVSSIVNATAGRWRIAVADDLVESHRLGMSRPF